MPSCKSSKCCKKKRRQGQAPVLSPSSCVLFVSNIVQDIPDTTAPVSVIVSGTSSVPVRVAGWTAQAGQGFRLKVTGNLNMGNAATPLVWTLSLNAATVVFNVDIVAQQPPQGFDLEIDINWLGGALAKVTGTWVSPGASFAQSSTLILPTVPTTLGLTVANDLITTNLSVGSVLVTRL